MKHILVLAFLLLFVKGYSEDGQHEWSINKRSAFFSFTAEFDCKRGDCLEGTGMRTYAGCPRYYYDLFDTQNCLEARGITRFFSLGALASWATDIDVYDVKGDYIGSIQGKVFTRARAKFVFYDINGLEIANAFLNTENAEFLLLDPRHEDAVMAQLKGRDFGDVASWELVSFRPIPVDARLLKVFGLFVADYHRSFLPQPKEVHYNFHHYHSN